MATSFPQLRLEHLLALVRLGMLVSGVYLFLLFPILLQMEYRDAARLQSMRGFRHEMFLIPLVVEELRDFVIRMIQGLFSLSSLFLQSFIISSAISRVMICYLEVARRMPSLLHSMASVLDVLLRGIELDQSRRAGLALPGKPLNLFTSCLSLFLLPGIEEIVESISNCPRPVWKSYFRRPAPSTRR